MNKLIALVLALLAGLSVALQAQKIASYGYTSAEGLSVRLEKTWAGAEVSQDFSVIDSPAGASSRALFKVAWRAGLSAAAQEIRIKNAKGALVEKLAPGRQSKPLAAGAYSAEILVNFGEWGLARFNLSGIVIKAAPPARPAGAAKRAPPPRSAVTTVSLDFNLPLLKFSKRPAARGGQARYEAVTWWAPGKRDSAGYIGRPWLFPPGVADPKKRIAPREGAEQWGMAKPGGYDLLLSVELGRSGRVLAVRIPGTKLLANHDHRVDLILNGSAVRVGGETVPTTIRLYPDGTAEKARSAKAVPGQALFSIRDPGETTICPPGSYDILYDYEKEGRIEWRPGMRLGVGFLLELDSAPAPVKIVSFDQGSPRAGAELRAAGDSYFSSDDEFLASYQYPDRFEGSFVIARLAVPAQAGGQGAREVERVSDGEKYRAAFVIARSRPALPEDLKPGMLVLWCVIDEYGRRANDRWFMGLVHDLSRAARGELVLLRHNHNAKASLVPIKLNLVRIIEEPAFKFRLDGENYLRLK